MKRLWVVLLFIFPMTGNLVGCAGNRERQLADKMFKDSIVLADGDKALGNIRFGISREEFSDQRQIFDREHDGTIYGILLQEITGEYNEEGLLHTVNFVSCYCTEDLHDNPFREFARDKFGEPLRGNKDVWRVGGRRIVLTTKKTIIGMTPFYFYHSSSLNPSLPKPQERDELLEYYTLSIVNDRLSREDPMKSYERRVRREEQERRKKEEAHQRRKQELDKY